MELIVAATRRLQPILCSHAATATDSLRARGNRLYVATTPDSLLTVRQPIFWGQCCDYDRFSAATSDFHRFSAATPQLWSILSIATRRQRPIVTVSRSARPGFESRPGSSPLSGLRGGKSLCEYCTNKINKTRPRLALRVSKSKIFCCWTLLQ